VVGNDALTWTKIILLHIEANIQKHTIKDFDSTQSEYKKFIIYTIVNIYHFIMESYGIISSSV